MAEIDLRKTGFSGRIIGPTAPDFTESSYRYSAIAERKARYIAYPKSAEDVSIAIIFASQAKLKIAVKSGGNHASGASSVEDGLVIDLGDLKGVEVDKSKMQAVVAGGCLWGDVYDALRDQGVVCVGGGVHKVGVGGHITGGGYGPLTQRFGMACDNVISATVVLADGRVVAANEAENADLFWGIKGGSSQFGVVTQFVLKVFPDQGSWFFRSSVFPGVALPSLIPKMVQFVNRERDDKKVILVFLNFVRGPPPQKGPLVVLNFTCLGHLDDFKTVFDFFFEASKPIIDHITDCPSLVELSHVLDDLLLSGPRRKATGALPITGLWPGLVEELWDRWLRYTDSNPDSIETKVILEIHRTIRQRPESSCFPVSEPHNILLISEEHSAESADARSLAWIHDLTTLGRLYQTRDGGKDWGLNANATMLNEKAEDIWVQNYPRLQRVKAKYDPNCVFDRFFHIEPDHD